MKRFSRTGQAKNAPRHEATACTAGPAGGSSSFIRTVTVGSGIRPDLLTIRIAEALAGSHGNPCLPPVGNSAPP